MRNFLLDLRRIHSCNRAPGFSFMADELSCGSFSSQHPSEWREDDQRAAERTESKYSQIFLTGDYFESNESKIFFFTFEVDLFLC